MTMTISDEMASASGLGAADAALVRALVDEWRSHYDKNRLRDRYYLGHAPVRDLGVTVSPAMARKVRPHVDWAAKCVDWWADRVQFEGVTCADEGTQATLDAALAANDGKELVHEVASSALRHSCAFVTVTSGDESAGEPSTVISGYPATAASALYDEAARRITAGLVVVATERRPGSQARRPRLAYVLTDTDAIVLDRGTSGWAAEYRPHSMGRAPMVHVAYHKTLGRPFGRSRITRAVRDIVDDAQREMLNMTVAAAFSAAPQKYIMGVDKEAARKIADTPFGAFVGSIFAATSNRAGQVPQFGQLAQMSMQPHADYMRMLAAQFSGTTGVPLSSLGVVTDNPSSAEAIYAGKEDAVVDIQSFIDGIRRSLSDACRMVLACERGTDYDSAGAAAGDILVNFAKPSMPSVVSQSDAMVKQISAIPWLADSDVTLRELGYDDEQIAQLRSDRRKSEARAGAQAILDRNQGATAGEDNAAGAGPVPRPAGGPPE